MLFDQCLLTFFVVFLLQKPDSSPVLGKNDLQFVNYVIEFLALAQRPRHNGEFFIKEWGWGPCFILFERIPIWKNQKKNTLKLRHGGVLLQKLLSRKSCDGINCLWSSVKLRYDLMKKRQLPQLCQLQLEDLQMPLGLDNLLTMIRNAF